MAIQQSSSFLRVILPAGHMLGLREAESPEPADKDAFPLNLESPSSSLDINQTRENTYQVSYRVAGCIVSQYRNTREGFFGPTKDRSNIELIERIFGEEVQKNDLLGEACEKGYVDYYRAHIFTVVSPGQLNKNQELINQSVDRALAYMNSQENSRVDPFAFVQAFIMHVNSLIFLHKDLSWEECVNYSRILRGSFYNLAPSCRDNIELIKSFFEQSSSDGPLSDGPLPETLKALTPIQQKGLLFAVFNAGFSVVGEPFYFVLEQLAAYPNRQEELYAKKGKERECCAEALFKEALRLKPENVITRTTNRGLEFFAKDQSGCIVWRHSVPEGSILEVINASASPDSTLFENPDVLTLHDQCPKTGDPLIFGAGPHRCPGKDLILLAIRKLLSGLIENYKIIDPTKEELLSTEKAFSNKLIFERRTL